MQIIGFEVLRRFVRETAAAAETAPSLWARTMNVRYAPHLPVRTQTCHGNDDAVSEIDSAYSMVLELFSANLTDVID